MKNQRIYSLDVIKLLLAYEIAINHYGIQLPPTPGVAVDVFFLISGYFLARKFYSKGDTLSSWDYTLGHVRGIYPHFLLAFLVFFSYYLARSVIYLVLEPSLHSLWELGAYLYDQIPELLLLHSTHYFMKSLLYPTWQVSAMLIAGYFIFELLKQNEPKTRKLILPAAVLMVQSLMYSGAGYFDNYGFFYLPLLRAFSSMGLGVLTFSFQRTPQWQQLRTHRRLTDTICMVGILGICLYGDRARIYLILAPLIVLICMEKDSLINRLLNHNCFRFCEKMSLAVYVNHSFIHRICETQIQDRFGIDKYQCAWIYIPLLTVYSVCTMLLIERIQKRK